jgi:hypothetical protein
MGVLQDQSLHATTTLSVFWCKLMGLLVPRHGQSPELQRMQTWLAWTDSRVIFVFSQSMLSGARTVILEAVT